MNDGIVVSFKVAGGDNIITVGTPAYITSDGSITSVPQDKSPVGFVIGTSVNQSNSQPTELIATVKITDSSAADYIENGLVNTTQQLTFKPKPMSIISKAQIKAKEAIQAEEDKAVFAALDTAIPPHGLKKIQNDMDNALSAAFALAGMKHEQKKKEDLIAQALSTPEGQKTLAEAMVAPIKNGLPMPDVPPLTKTQKLECAVLAYEKGLISHNQLLKQFGITPNDFKEPSPPVTNQVQSQAEELPPAHDPLSEEEKIEQELQLNPSGFPDMIME